MQSSEKQQTSLTNFFCESRKRTRNSSLVITPQFPKRTGSRFGHCPICESSFPWHTLENHAATCSRERKSDADNRRIPTSSSKCQVVTSNSGSILRQTKSNRLPPNCVDKETDSDRSSSNNSPTLPSNCPTTLRPLSLPRKIQEPCLLEQAIQPPSVVPSVLPPGLFLYPNFLTSDEEEQLIDLLDDTTALPPWKMGRFNGQHAGKRWGVHCNLRDRRVDAPEHPLPPLLESIVFLKLSSLPCWNQLATKRPNFQPFCPNEANAIDYRCQRGDWLQAHVDDRKLSTEPIINLSLIGDCIMTFAKGGGSNDEDTFRVHLPRRGLQILTGPARYNYTHAIANEDLLSDRRVSITMRESPRTHKKATATIPGLPKITTVFSSKK